MQEVTHISLNNDKQVYSNLKTDISKTAFYQLLINQMQVRDCIPFFETVGANLCQNFYFLSKNADLWCSSDNTCSRELGLWLCVLDCVASGIQNAYQRFWKSVMWTWMSRLSTPAKSFIHSVDDFIQETPAANKGQTLVIYISQQNYAAIQEKIEITNSLDLLNAYYGIGISLCIGEKNQTINQVGNADIESQTEVASTVKSWEFFHENKTYCEIFKKNVAPLNLFSSIFLLSIPCGMLMSQTIGMMSKINPQGNKNIIIANMVCLLGAAFGIGKWQVNNTLRLKMANDNLRAMISPSLYLDCGNFFFTSIMKIFYGFLFLVPFFSWNPKQAMSHTLPAFLRLFGIFIGINIALFYLYVGLFTKDGIEFSLNTIMKNCSVDSQEVIASYEGFHIYIDIICAISSLFFNGILTQLPESIKKCDDLAKKIEKWVDSSEQSSSVSVSKKEVTPAWIHVANVIDISVFALSAMTSIAGLLVLLIESNYSFIVPLAVFLQKMHYAEIAGICAGVANLIFTYAAAAPGQMGACRALGAKVSEIIAGPASSVSDECQQPLLEGHQEGAKDSELTDSLSSDCSPLTVDPHSTFFSGSEQNESNKKSCCAWLKLF